MSETAPITKLLRQAREGDARAMHELMPLLYDELRRLAGGQMRGERQGHTLQPTALVHDAYVRLVDMEIDWQDRHHFFAMAARTMRRILVEHARARQRHKRGGGAVRVALDDLELAAPEAGADILRLHDALSRFSEIDERRAEALELHYFGGLSYSEIARARGASEATVKRDLRFARAWLLDALSEPEGPAPRTGQ